MERKKRINNILSNNFKSWQIEVIDISFLHEGHNNFDGKNETHFSIILNNKNIKNFNRIDIHRKIHFLLKDEFSSGLQALEIKLKN